MPLFLMMATGFLLKKAGLFDLHTLKKMNTVSFNLFLPVLLISNIYSSNIRENFDLRIVAFGVVTIIAVWAICMAVVPRIIKDNPSRGVIVQASFRGNYILFALSIMRFLYGDGNTGMTGILGAFVVPLYNVLVVITFEIFRGGKLNIKQVLSSIAKNPLIIGSVTGIVLQLLDIKLFYILERVLYDVGNIATPLALIILGGFFEFSATKTWLKRTLITSALKLCVVPLFFTTIAIVLGFRGSNLATLYILHCSPVAVSSFTMASEMGGNKELASQLTVFTSLGSVLTIFLGVFLLRSFGLI